MNRTNGDTNTNNDRQAYWWEQATECMQTLSTFLRSKRKTITMAGVNLEHGAPVFGQNYSTTFTRAQARKAVITILLNRVKPNDKGYVRGDSTHLPTTRKAFNECGDRFLADALAEESTYKGVSKNIAVKVMSGYNGTGLRYDAQIAVSGNGYTVKGVSGTFHSRKQAVKIAARKHFEAEWKSANEINCQESRNAIKAQVIADGLVSLNGTVVQPPQRKASAPAPVAKQSSVSTKTRADLLAQAQGIGVTGTSKMNKAQLTEAIAARMAALGF